MEGRVDLGVYEQWLRFEHTITSLVLYNTDASAYIFIYLFLSYSHYYPRRARSAIGVDTVFTLDVCLYVCMLVL